MTPPTPPRQSTPLEALADTIAMKALGFLLVLLGAGLLVVEGVPVPPWNPAPRQSIPLVSIYAAMIVLGSGMVIGSRFVTYLTGLLGAVGKYLPGHHGDDK